LKAEQNCSSASKQHSLPQLAEPLCSQILPVPDEALNGIVPELQAAIHEHCENSLLLRDRARWFAVRAQQVEIQRLKVLSIL
jgi:hypothetical protein